MVFKNPSGKYLLFGGFISQAPASFVVVVMLYLGYVGLLVLCAVEWGEG